MAAFEMAGRKPEYPVSTTGLSVPFPVLQQSENTPGHKRGPGVCGHRDNDFFIEAVDECQSASALPHKCRDPAHSDTAVQAFGLLRGDLQEALTVALDDYVLGRHIEILAQ